MSAPPAPGPRLLVVGGCGGLVGRAVLNEFRHDRGIRSVHRSPAAGEAEAGVEWVPGNVETLEDWTPYLEGVDTVLNLAWYRQARARRFVALRDGLLRLVRAAERANVRRFVHVSVPPAPAALEEHLPYLANKRVIDRAIGESSLSYVIVRPTMLFAPRDVLATVMLRTMARYHRFPLFGDGAYHLSPIAASDLARAIRIEGERGGRRTVDLGGPRRYRYRDLTDRMFAALGLPARYFRLSPRNSVRLAWLLESLGSSLLYEYEAIWLLSDMLGLPAYSGLDRPLEAIEPFLDLEAARWRPRRRRAPAPPTV